MELEYNNNAPSGAEEMLSAIRDREKTYKEEDLASDLNWLEASGKIYQMNNDGEKFTGDPKALAKYGIDQMSEFNYNVSGMNITDPLEMRGSQEGTLSYVQKVENADHETQVAFAYMMDTYDKKDITTAGVMRALKETAVDPLTYVGISTLGAGLAFRKGAEQVAKEGFKNRLHGAIRSYLTSGLAVGATEGALYTAGDEVARESVYQDADLMDGYSAGNIAAATAVGGLAGAGVVKGLGYAGKGIGKGIDYVRKQGEEAMAQVAGGGTPPNYVDIKPNTKDTIKLYRGTSETGAGGGESLVGKGLYLTPNVDTAKKYGSKIEEVEIKNENMYDATSTMTDKEYKEFVRLFRGERGIEYMPDKNIGYTYEFLKDDIGANTGLDYEEVAEKMNTLIKKKGFEGMMFDLSRVTDSTQEGEKAFLLFKKETK